MLPIRIPRLFSIGYATWLGNLPYGRLLHLGCCGTSGFGEDSDLKRFVSKLSAPSFPLPKLFEKASGVGRWLTLLSMKRSYQTDLTDAEWEAL